MKLLFEKQRGKTTDFDSYYSTPYKNVFIHHFIGGDRTESFGAEKIIGEGKNDRGKLGIVLRLSKRSVLPILGGISSTMPVSRRTLDEAIGDAKFLSNKKKESKTVAKQFYSNYDLFCEIREHLNEKEPRSKSSQLST